MISGEREPRAAIDQFHRCGRSRIDLDHDQSARRRHDRIDADDTAEAERSRQERADPIPLLAEMAGESQRVDIDRSAVGVGMGLPGRDTDQLPTRADQTRSPVRHDKHPGHRQPGAELLPDAPLRRGQRCAASLGSCPGNNSSTAAAGMRLPQPAAIARNSRRVVERPRKADPRIGQHRPQMLRRADATDRLPTVASQRPRGGDRIDEPGMVLKGAGVAPRTGREALGRLG